jgi:hypothetical protein
MKKAGLLFLFVLILSGCTTYRFSRGKNTPHEQGYVVSRDNYAILEYTLGKDNSVPAELELAKERFHRRKSAVEYYYKKMGYIESNFKRIFWDTPAMLVKFIFGQLRLPFIAISDYKYAHNAKYKEKIDKIDQERDNKEAARISGLKQELDSYIQKDLTGEPPVSFAKVESIVPEPSALEEKAEAANQKSQVMEKEFKQAASKELETEVERGIVSGKKEAQERQLKKLEVPTAIKAVIIARPSKGFSPLTVHFYAGNSYSPGAKIIAYSWDFGDGDTSNKKNPVNTYYSGTYEPKSFTVTLNITDNKGNIATASCLIEVLNR